MRGKVGELYTGHASMDTRFDDFDRQWSERSFAVKLQNSFCESHLAPNYILRRYRIIPRLCRLFALESKGGFLVEKIEGCHTNVIGLSLPLLRQMLAKWDMMWWILAILKIVGCPRHGPVESVGYAEAHRWSLYGAPWRIG